jgi:imidazolonepropionase-like amidohydrolase
MRTVLLNGKIIDGLGNPAIDDGFITFKDGKITALGNSGEFSRQDDDVVYDLTGMTVLPGLIDAHVHLFSSGKMPESGYVPPKFIGELTQLVAAQSLRLHLEAGFTTVRDVGSMNNPVWALRHAAQEGILKSPRLVASGKLLTVTGGHGTEYGVDMAWECDGASDLIKGVRRQSHEGADFIKVIASRKSKEHPEGLAAWSVDELKTAVDEAHEYGLKTSAHVSGAAISVDFAVQAGVDSLEHGWGITPESMGIAAEKGIFLVPTLSVYFNMIKVAEEGRWRRPVEGIREFWGSEEDRYKEIELARKYGVLLVLGTDAGNPDTYHGSGAKESEWLVKLGCTPMEAIIAGTSNAARLCGVEDETGSLEIGKGADLLLVKGDPLDDITILQDPANIKAVFKAGVLAHTPVAI